MQKHFITATTVSRALFIAMLQAYLGYKVDTMACKVWATSAIVGLSAGSGLKHLSTRVWYAKGTHWLQKVV